MSVIGQSRILSSTLFGVEAVLVSVEVSITYGLPGFNIVGMADTSVQESRERVRSAIKASGFEMPNDRVVINLAPGTIKKIGSGFDLPIALGLLVASGQLDNRFVENRLFVGELGLNGTVKEIPGLMAHARRAQIEGLDFYTSYNQNQVANLLDVESCGLVTLRDVINPEVRKLNVREAKREKLDIDFSEINGHDVAKRALQIAAVGGLGVLLIGPPGSGKTMLASRMPTILPALTNEEMLETVTIYSVAQENFDSVLNGNRPFRAPHHTASTKGLIGGGTPVRPGEVSLAHNGVLFLDELSEFQSTTLQSLRQPMESGKVVISRADSQTTFPARFSLIAATNPCPCGYSGDKKMKCRCSQRSIDAYQSRVGGPLLDRIAIQLPIQRLTAHDVLESGNGITSEELRTQVERGIQYSLYRLMEHREAENHSKLLLGKFHIDKSACSLIENWANSFNLSGRRITNTLKIARAIADMSENYIIRKADVEEAMNFVDDKNEMFSY